MSKNDFEQDWITEFDKNLSNYGADNIDLNEDEINKLYSEHLEYYEYMKNLDKPQKEKKRKTRTS